MFFFLGILPPLLRPCLLGDSDLDLLCTDLLMEGRSCKKVLDRSLLGDGNLLLGISQLFTTLRLLLLLLLFNTWLFRVF